MKSDNASAVWRRSPSRKTGPPVNSERSGTDFARNLEAKF